jgi:cell division septation protein DedD
MAGDKSWEGQSFTLVIFVGVVVLCSVFFVLGMLAGRSQGTTIDGSDTITVESEAALEAEPEEPDFTFFESVAESELPGLEVRPGTEVTGENPVPVENELPSVAESAVPVPSADPIPSQQEAAIILQVVALRNAEQAQSLREELVEKGFPAFVLLPGPDDPNPLNRVQVGPLGDDAEVVRVRQALEAEGHRPIVVR